MDKQITDTKILFSFKNKSCHCDNMDEPGGHFIKQSKTGKRRTNIVLSLLHIKSKERKTLEKESRMLDAQRRGREKCKCIHQTK